LKKKKNIRKKIERGSVGKSLVPWLSDQEEQDDNNNKDYKQKKTKKKKSKKKKAKTVLKNQKEDNLDADYFGNNSNAMSIYSSQTTETRGWKDIQYAATADNDNKNEGSKTDNTNEIKHQIELINAFRRRMRIHVKGDMIPKPAETFESIRFNGKKDEHVRRILLNNIESSRYKEPTPIQMQAIPVMMKGRDIVAVAPTGSGKTAAFLIPLIGHVLKRPVSNINASIRKKNALAGEYNNCNGTKITTTKALILTPTRELAGQIFRDFQRLSFGKKFKASVLSSIKLISNRNLNDDDGNSDDNSYGGTDTCTNINSAQQFDLLIATPLRLLTVLKENLLSLKQLKCLILDEADKLFEDGFLSQIDEIIHACGTTAEEQKQLQRGMFSATMPQGIEDLVKSVLIDPIRVQIGQRGAATETIEQKLVFVGREEGKLIAMRQLIQEGGMTPPVIMFVQSKDRATALYKELVYDGINVDVIHADRTKNQRDTIIKKFRIGEIWVLIATDLMARGMDFKGVNCVINYDFPQSTVSYVHRIGRTGRAGRKGKAITFFTENDMKYLRSIANVMKISGCDDVPDWMLKLKKTNKNEKKYMKKYAPKRQNISTTSGFDKKKRNNKKRKFSKSGQK
jgi:ATP-dependent RNA helicase DDX52/ROK1